MGISFSVVEEIDASVVGGRHAFEGNIFTHLPTVCYPGAEGQLADL
jgi:hypothetical protein